MALYALIGIDRPGAIERRDEIRAEHRAYVQANKDRIRIAGPFLDEAGAQIGSLIVFEADDPAYVWDWIHSEPFYQDGIYQHVEVRHWGVSIGGIDRNAPV